MIYSAHWWRFDDWLWYCPWADMAYADSYFELHIGFPDDPLSEAAADAFLREGTPTLNDWSRSQVRAVHTKGPGCIDPHNVPGTLGSLISQPVFVRQGPWPATTIQNVLVPVCEEALALLRRLGVSDARLEIECPFGWLSFRQEHGTTAQETIIRAPLTIPSEQLTFISGAALPNTPEWEIHFVVERNGNASSPALQLDEVPKIVEAFGVDVEQTIEYRSQSMLRRGSQDYKFISTAYYSDAHHAESEAKRLFEGTSLCADFMNRGYSVSFIVEHIVGCFRPFDNAPVNEGSQSEVTSAR